MELRTTQRHYLNGADLNGADLSGADLSEANLSMTNLSEANLNMAKLNDAGFEAARSFTTAWINVDLSTVEGLDTIRHSGPSSVGVDTLYLSDGRIPPEFLRGCGRPDYFVGLVPGLTVTSAIQHFSAFISYSHSDNAAAGPIDDHLFHASKIPT